MMSRFAGSRIADAHPAIGRATDVHIDVDRTRAQFVGLTERDVTTASPSIWRAGASGPDYFLNPDNGVSYTGRDANPNIRSTR